MSGQGFLGVFRSWLSRGWFLFAVLAVLALVLVDVKKMASHAKPSTLSRLRPDYHFIGEFADGTAPFDRKALEDQRVYLENVSVIMGERPDTDALLGYVLFYLGDKTRAEELFIKASKLNPTFFWNGYDLGVLAFARGETEKARDLLQRSVSLAPELSVKFLVTSRVFIPLMVEGGYSPQKFLQRLFEGYADAYKILTMIEFSGQRFDQALALAQDGLRVSFDNKDRAFFYYFIGASALRAGALPTAVQALEECLRLDAEYPEALVSMAVVLKGLGKDEAASEFLERAKAVQVKRPSGLPKADDFRIKVF